MQGKTKIEAPNKSYTGLGPGGLAFANGVAYTDDPVITDYCARHGYKVSGPAEPETKPATVFEDPQTVRQGHQALSAPSEDASVSRGMTEDQRREAYGKQVGQMIDKEGVTPPSIGPSTIADPNDEAPEHPGGTEQIGLTRDQADHAAAVRAGLASAPHRKAPTPRKTTARKSTARKSTGTRSNKSAGKSNEGGNE